MPKPDRQPITASSRHRWPPEWRRRHSILAFFYHHASNGPTEAISGRLEALRRNTLGFRNLTHYRIRSPLHGGALHHTAAVAGRLDGQEDALPGAVALVRSPAGELSTTYGTTTVGGTIPVSLADHIRIGSITKTWIGTVILQLAQEGKLSLDDPVSKFRPDTPDGEHITIAELLNVRSGF